MPSPSPQSDGNRKDPRARVLNMTVRYRSATVDEFIENHSHDISRGGMFIKTRSPFPAGTLLKFEVRIAEDQKLMHGVGRVVWRREDHDNGGDPPAGMGIKFIKTGEGASALIEQLVNARKGKASNFETGSEQEAAQSESAGAAGTSGQAIDSSRTTMPPPDFVDSGEDAAPVEVGILVSSPPKARHDHAPERRKVVLQEDSTSDTDVPETGNKHASEPPATLPPRAQRAPESAHGAAVSPQVAQAALAAAEAPKQSSGLGGIAAALAIAAGGWLLLRNVGSQPSQPATDPTAATASTPGAPVPSAEPVAVAPAPTQTGSALAPSPQEAPAPPDAKKANEISAGAQQQPRESSDEPPTAAVRAATPVPGTTGDAPAAASNIRPPGVAVEAADPSSKREGEMPDTPVAPAPPVVAKVAPPKVKPASPPTPPKVTQPSATTVARPTPPAKPIPPEAPKTAVPAKAVTETPAQPPPSKSEKPPQQRETAPSTATAKPEKPPAAASPEPVAPTPRQPPRTDDNPY